MPLILHILFYTQKTQVKLGRENSRQPEDWEEAWPENCPLLNPSVLRSISQKEGVRPAILCVHYPHVLWDLHTPATSGGKWECVWKARSFHVYHSS